MDIIFIQNGVLLDLDQEESHVNQYTFRSEQDLGVPIPQEVELEKMCKEGSDIIFT